MRTWPRNGPCWRKRKPRRPTPRIGKASPASATCWSARLAINILELLGQVLGRKIPADHLAVAEDQGGCSLQVELLTQRIFLRDRVVRTDLARETLAELRVGQCG